MYSCVFFKAAVRWSPVLVICGTKVIVGRPRHVVDALPEARESKHTAGASDMNGTPGNEEDDGEKGNK